MLKNAIVASFGLFLFSSCAPDPAHRYLQAVEIDGGDVQPAPLTGTASPDATAVDSALPPATVTTPVDADPLTTPADALPPMDLVPVLLPDAAPPADVLPVIPPPATPPDASAPPDPVPPDAAPAPAMLTGLFVNDLMNAPSWSVRPALNRGDRVFGDREYTFTSVSDGLLHRPWVRPANDSKGYVGDPLFSFTITAPATVFLGVDGREQKPAWAADWILSGERLTFVDKTNAMITYRVFMKAFPAGEIGFGPQGCAASPCSNVYIVIVAP